MKQTLSLLALTIGLMAGNVSVASAESNKDKSGREDSDENRSGPEKDDDGDGRSLVYTPFANLTGVQKLKAAGLRYSFSTTPGSIGFTFTQLEPFGAGMKANYDAGTGNVTYTTPGGLSVAFTAADEVVGQSTPSARLFFKPNPAGGIYGGSLTTPSVNSVPLSYTRFGTFFTQGTPAPLDGHAFVLGVPTAARDVPKRGTATYTSVVGGQAFAASNPVSLRLTGSTATFSANFSTGAINTALQLVGTPVSGGATVALDNVTGVGSISGTKPGFTGLFTGTGTVNGNFAGAFFGPRAVEFGYDFLVGGTNAAGLQFSAIGGVAGTNAPLPPPPPTYTAFQDLTGVQTFSSAGMRYTVGSVPSGGAGFISTGTETLGSGVAVVYDTASGNLTLTAPNGMSTTFTAADEVAGQSTPTSRLYNKANPAGGVFGGSLSVPSISGVPLSYTRFATFYAAGSPAGFDGHAFVFGVQTQAGDVPTTGTATYSGGAGGSVFLAGVGTPGRLTNSSATLTANFATGSIATVLNLLVTPNGGVETPLDVITGIGSLGAVKPGFSGTLAGTGTVAGNFGGAFFGPQAAEFGYDFVVGGVTSGGVGFTAVGGAAGKKP